MELVSMEILNRMIMMVMKIFKLENLDSLSDIELSKVPMINPLIFYY